MTRLAILLAAAVTIGLALWLILASLGGRDTAPDIIRTPAPTPAPPAGGPTFPEPLVGRPPLARPPARAPTPTESTRHLTLAPGKIVGFVGGDDGRLEGAIISAIRPNAPSCALAFARTDADGQFVMTRPPGYLVVRARCTGYRDAIVPAEPSPIYVRLRRARKDARPNTFRTAREVIVSGSVTDEGTGKAVADASVEVSGQRWRRATTEANGRFSTEVSVHRGTIEIAVLTKAAGYRTRRTTHRLTDREVEVHVRLTRTPAVRGIVTNPFDVPLPNATVFSGFAGSSAADGGSPGSVKTDANGAFTIHMTEHAVAHLAADAPGYGRGFSGVIDPSKGARDVVIKLVPENRVTVRVETPAGGRLGGVPVRLRAGGFPAASLGGERRARTDARGEHTFAGLSAGRFSASTPVARQVDRMSQRVMVGRRTPTATVTLRVTRMQWSAWEDERRDFERLKKKLGGATLGIDTDWQTRQMGRLDDEWDAIVRRRARRAYYEKRAQRTSDPSGKR